MRITREAAGYVCKFGYDADLVAALQGEIPSRWRRWDPERALAEFALELNSVPAELATVEREMGLA